jgi:hypothetical protein
MNDIRILINIEEGKDSYKEYLTDERFIIDSRVITTIGIDNSADTLTEYDAIILNYKEPMNYIPDRIEQILNFLNQENKLFVYVLNKHKENQHHHSNTMIIGEIINRLGGNANEFIYTTPSGSNFKVTEEAKRNIFYNYLNCKSKSWKISFRSKKCDFIIPLAINTDGNYVSFSLKNDQLKSHNAFIPWLSKSDKTIWTTVASFLIENKQDYQNVGAWVSNYTFKNLKELNEMIEERRNNISDLEEEKSTLENQKKKYERIRNVLLYHDGELLKEVCKEVLTELGLNIQDGKQGREDLIFVFRDKHYLIEVKGCEKSTNKGHIKQVGSHKTEYKHDNEEDVKGILLINAWRKLPLEDRNTNDKLIFPNEIMKLVKLSNIALMTTQQLFAAYCQNLEENFELNAFVENLKNTSGIMKGYNNIELYQEIKTNVN